MPTLADVIGYALRPNRFAGCVTVCPSCFRPELDRFEAVYSGDELGEVYEWTVDDEDPVHCDVCGAKIHPGSGRPVATYHVLVMRLIETSVEVKADSPLAAAARVGRADFPLPEHNEWGTVKGDELRVFDQDYNEIEELEAP